MSQLVVYSFLHTQKELRRKFTIENNFVANGLVPKARPWIGLFDKTENSDWIWVDGQLLQDGYTNWAPGQPDHWSDAPGYSESCVEMWQDSNGLG